MINVLNKISDHAIKSELDQLSPNTQSQLIGVYSMGVKIFNSSYLIGTLIILLEYILKSKYILSLDSSVQAGWIGGSAALHEIN